MPRLPSEQFAAFGDDIAPNFELLISGKDTSGAAELYEAIRPLIVGVTFEDDEEMSSLFELTIENQPDTAPGSPVDWRAVIDSRAFAEGNAIDLWMGYGSSMSYMDRIEIVKWLPNFPEAGPATFRVKGFDGRHHMMQGNQFKSGGGGGPQTVQKDPKTLDSVISTKSGKKGSGTTTTVGVVRSAGGGAIKAKGKQGGKAAKKRKSFYKGMTDEQIVQKVAEKYGFGYNVDTTEARKRATTSKKISVDPATGKPKVQTKAQHVMQTRVQAADVTDWQFLQKLAAINRFDLWVDWDLKAGRWVVHFKKRDDTGEAGYAFEYNGEDGSLISAEPDFSIKDQTTDVEVLVFDRQKRKVERTMISGQEKAEDVQLAGGRLAPGKMKAQKEIAAGASVRFTAFGQAFEAFSDKPFGSRKAAETFVANLLKERERDFLIVQGKVVGVPTLRARQFHELRGLGKRLDGLYRFTNVRHNMNPGQAYTCEFTAHKVLGTLTSRTAESKEAGK